VRRLTLALLLVGFAWIFGSPSFSRADASFDPLSPRGREAERAIEEGRFADARPIVVELQKTHADDPVLAYWMAEIEHGSGTASAEAAAWARVLALTHEADAACPALPNAYARAGDSARARDGQERCAAPDGRESGSSR
jgi:hypothetical protein